MIDEKYLRFTRDQMRQHFLVDAEKQIKYFQASANRYREFLQQNPKTHGISMAESKLPRQIEKDERFWTAASLKQLFDCPNRIPALTALLSSAFGDKPPVEGVETWEECVAGDLKLYFEAQAPSPPSYINWLRRNLPDRHCIPYVFDAAARESQRTLEGPTHFDAILLNPSNGFSLMIEAKVLSDISPHVSFDMLRNQLVRCIDVMLEQQLNLQARNPDRSLFALLTPTVFRDRAHSRLYGWLLEDYRANPDSISRDLPHRVRSDWAMIASRLGWMTFEDIEAECPGACPWL
jgi:hypothetical protein